MKHILIYVPQHAVAMSAVLIKELCWAAASYAYAGDPKEGDPKQTIKLVSLSGKNIQSFSGIQLSVDTSLQTVINSNAPVDAVFLCAFWGAVKPVLKESAALLSWIQDLHNKQVPIAAVSNGPFFLAAAGLLNGKVATVYPPAIKQFQCLYPDITLQPAKGITNAGNLYCANGIASGCDLTVSIIEMLYGANVARKLSQDFLVGFNRTYTIANIALDGQKYHQDSQILTAQHWLEQHYNSNVSLEAVATDVNMSPRNFSRRFKLATGDSPGHYLLKVRIEAAKELLQTSDLSVAEIGYRVGYDDLSYFSRVFRKQEGCLPHQYREQLHPTSS